MLDGKIVDCDNDKLFKNKTNLPKILRAQNGARVMFLNNSQVKHKICNGKIGVITDVDVENMKARVAFTLE